MTVSTSNITKQLTSLTQSNLTGRLDIRASNGREWKLFFRLGRLIWGDDSYHPNRFAQRHLNKYYPQLNLKKINLRDSDEIESYNYQLFTLLFQGKLINQEQIEAIITDRIEGIIFDLMQQETREVLNYTVFDNFSSPVQQIALRTSFALVNVRQALKSTKQKWTAWCKNNWLSIDPNFAPIIKNPARLKQEVSDLVYQNFSNLIDGNNTLRDLASQINADLIKLTYSLISYLDKGLLDLVEVTDIKPPISLVKPEIESRLVSVNTDRRLIACIDDSQQIIRVMEQIISEAGYQFIGIKQPIVAIPKLIASNPHLIFLDLVMPFLSGYELYTQIRRVSKLEEIPIIILTGNDGIIDKMRTKFIGAHDFISKPIEEEKVLNAIKLNSYFLQK